MLALEPVGLAQRRRRWRYWVLGFVVGWLTGVVTLAALSAISVHQVPKATLVPGGADVKLGINIRYLNDIVQRRLAASPQVVVGDIKTLRLDMGLLPQAGLELTPTFDVAGLFQASPTADNQLEALDGKLAMHMIGQPRLGDLQVSPELLPFDLTSEVHKAVDQITNSVLLDELNSSIKSGFGSDTFNVVEVQTDGDYLAVKLQRK